MRHYLKEEVLNEMQMLCIGWNRNLTGGGGHTEEEGTMEGPVTFPWLSSLDLHQNPAHCAQGPEVYLEMCLSSLRVTSGQKKVP